MMSNIYNHQPTDDKWMNLKQHIIDNNCKLLKSWFQHNSLTESYTYECNENILQISSSMKSPCSDCIQLLLENVNIGKKNCHILMHKNLASYTALDLALQNKNMSSGIRSNMLEHYRKQQVDVSDVLYKLFTYIDQTKENEEDYANIINDLLLENIEVNYVDDSGWTCLYIAAKCGFKKIIESLIENKQFSIYLNSFLPDTASPRTIISSENLYHKHLPSEPEATVDINTLYKNLLRLDLNNFIKNFLQIKITLTNHQKKELLRRAIKYNETEFSKFLFQNIQEKLLLSQPINNFLATASEHGNKEIVAVLLSKLNIESESNSTLLNIKKELVSKSIIQLLKTNISYNSPNADYMGCLKALLEIEGIDLNYAEIGGTALHYAARYQNREFVLELLKKGAHLGAKDSHKAVVTEINHSVLREYFDECMKLENNNFIDNSNANLSINFKSLLRPHQNSQSCRNVSEINILQEIAEDKELNPLLLHPVMLLFIYLKWIRIKWLKQISLIVYGLGMVLLVIYIETKDSIRSKFTIWFILTLVVVIQIFKMIHFYFTNKCHWCNHLKNEYLKILLKIIHVISLAGVLFSEKIGSIAVQFEAVAILVNAILLFFTFEQMSFFSTYVHMLRIVCFEFFKLFMCTFILFIGFTYSFFCILMLKIDEKYEKISSIGRIFTKTISMSIGELNEADIAFHIYPVSYIIFIVFVFYITIALSNLASGLAVSDVQEVKNNAEINEQIYRINCIASYEYIYPEASPMKVILKGDNEYKIENLNVKLEKKIQDAIKKTRKEIKEAKERRIN